MIYSYPTNNSLSHFFVSVGLEIPISDEAVNAAVPLRFLHIGSFAFGSICSFVFGYILPIYEFWSTMQSASWVSHLE